MLFAEVSTNIYDVWIVTIPGLIAAISSIVMGVINNRNTNKNKKSIDENKNAIHKIGTEMNGNLEALIQAKEKIAFIKGVESINVNDVYKITQQIDDIWKHLKEKALLEAKIKGFIYTHNNTLVVSDKIRIGYQSIVSELKKWYIENKDLSDLELFKDCQQQFGSELIEKVCKPYNIFDGTCIEIAILIAKEE